MTLNTQKPFSPASISGLQMWYRFDRATTCRGWALTQNEARHWRLLRWAERQWFRVTLHTFLRGSVVTRAHTSFCASPRSIHIGHGSCRSSPD